MQAFETLKGLIGGCADDVTKTEAGNKAAATRLRKTMQRVKAAAQNVRKASLGDPKKAVADAAADVGKPVGGPGAARNPIDGGPNDDAEKTEDEE